MKQIIIIATIIIVLSSSLFSQSTIDNVLKEVENNNTTLSALRKQADAEKLANRTGIYLQNPEVEFNYLWGNPISIGNRTDMSITQTFDFPTAYAYKNQISKSRNEQVELEFQKQRKDLLLKARLVCIELVYFNALKAELSKRSINAEHLASSYSAKFKAGETNILEYNKAQMNLMNLTKELENLDIERNSLLHELAYLNGGNFIEFNDVQIESAEISTDFNTWYLLAEPNNPILNWVRQEVEISQKQLKLNRALSLPKFQTGYMSENVIGEKFQGVTVGMSIPLWENKNRLKYAESQAEAWQSVERDKKLQFYNQLKNLHTKAIALQKNVADYQLNLKSFDNSELLKKALDAGEISLIEYMLELSFYYESVNNLLDMERELNKTLAELNQFI